MKFVATFLGKSGKTVTKTFIAIRLIEAATEAFDTYPELELIKIEREG